MISTNPTAVSDGGAREERILAAARDAFLEFGFAATSMDLVAQRANASKTTLYTRFPSKEALFAATITAECERRGMRFSPQDFADLSIDEALRRIARRFVDLIWSSAAIRVEQVVIGEAARFPEVAAIFKQQGPERVCAAVEGYFVDAAARGLIAVADPRFAAEQFLSALKGMPHCELVLGLRPPPPEAERDAFVAKAVALFLDGVRER
jgi:TetR/AcrR family transcriptional repressor of mexJK operon